MRFKNIVSSTYLVFIVFAACIYFPNTVNAQVQDEDAFEVYLDFRHRGVINTLVISYYKNDQFYLPVKEIFSLFEIEVNIRDINISGNFSFDQIPYSIDFSRQIIIFGEIEYELSSDDYIIGDLDSYLPINVFSELFDLSFTVDFNTLTMKLETNQELPIFERLLRQQKRTNLTFQNQEVNFYPLLESDNTSFLDGGFLDYSFTGVYSPNTFNSFNFSNAFGLELIGGELSGSIFGNQSQSMFSYETNNLRWRRVLRDNNLVTEFTVGQTNTDGVLTTPYTGIRITNDPVEPRRFFDEFELTGTTIAQSEVELYINNNLIDFQTADDFGTYRFLTPLSYGSSEVDLRIFGPTGQIIRKSSRIQVPFNFLPVGDLNYDINAGKLDNSLIGSLDEIYTYQANATYGLAKWVTAKFGIEYYDNIAGFVSPSYSGTLFTRLFNSYIVSLEAVTNGYYRGSLNKVYPNSSSINIDFLEFNSTSGIYNSSGYKRQVTGNFFYPLSIGSLPLNFRVSTFTRYLDELYFSTLRFELQTRINKINIRTAYRDQFVSEFSPFSFTENSEIQSSITYNFVNNRSVPNFLRGTFFRGQANYVPISKQLRSTEFLFSRNISKNGRIQFSYGRDFVFNTNNIRLNLVIDFNKFRTNTTVSSFNDNFSSTQNVRGSIGYDSNYNKTIFTSRNQVGRSGLAIKLFLDNNNDGSFTEGQDELIPEGLMRLGRSGALNTSKDNILYYTQLQPYFRYNLELNEASISNPMLIPNLDEFSIISSPNSFKKIEIPFYTAGVIEGTILRFNPDTDQANGIGGLKLLLTSLKDGTVKEIRTFSDGSFYDYPLAPGEYELSVDQDQLNFLQVKSDPEVYSFNVQTLAEGDFIEGININLIPLNTEEADSSTIQPITLAMITDEIKSTPEVLEFSQEKYQDVDEALRFIILAQNAFYAKDLSTAFNYVSESLELFETAQGYALKGSFYYFEGNTEQAQRHWQMALRFNPDLFIPNMELLEERVTTSSSED